MDATSVRIHDPGMTCHCDEPAAERQGLDHRVRAPRISPQCLDEAEVSAVGPTTRLESAIVLTVKST